MEGEWPLVGRTAELERVDGMLREGGPGGVVLAGRAGVGKTRLAEECLALAVAQGFTGLRIGATPAASPLPFGAFAALLPELVPGMERSELLRRASRAVLAKGEGKPVALLVDDAHVLDDASAALTHQLAAGTETFVLATVRSGEPASDAVVALWKDGLAERVELTPFSPPEVGALLSAVLGGPVDGATVRLLFERTEGNVLFLRELVLSGIQAGVFSDEGGLWRLRGRLPASARLVELVEARLAGLSDADRESLEVLALGEPLGVDLLLEQPRQPDLSGLERWGLVRIQEDGRRLQARLGHPLYGEVLRSRISPLRNRVVSRSLADAVERTGARRREDVLRVGSWRLDGGGEVRPELMVPAGRQARRLFGFELAERLVRAGIDAGAGFEAELFLAELLSLQGRDDEAEDVLVALGQRAGDDLQRTAVALLRIDNLFWAGRADEAMTVLAEAEAAIADPAHVDGLTVKRATVRFFGGFTAEAIALLDPILDRVTGQALVEACVTVAYAFGSSGRTTAALDAGERGLAAHRAVDFPHLMYYPAFNLMSQARALVWAGRLAEAESLARRSYEEALNDEATEPQVWFARVLGECCLLQGRGQTASRWMKEAVGLLRPLGRQYLRNQLAVLAGSLVLAGEVDEAEAVLSEIDELPVTGIRWQEADLLRVRASVAVARDDRAAAERLLEEAVATAVRAGDCVYESAALHDLARLGRAAEVADRLTALAAIVEGPLAPARAAHAAALATADPAALEAASAAFEEMGALLLAAEAAADAAAAWRNNKDSRRAAAAERRSQLLAGRCEGARTPALIAVSARVTLTDRELEIARLAAAGVSNKDIAARLYLSVHTVQNKLHAVYQKLGVVSRAELAEALEGY